MCGIAGELKFDARVGPKADWKQISALMARRGPNDEGMWTDSDRCTLVFRRLSIIDLSQKAHQPMVAQNRQYALVFNGEIYNFRELRAELEGKGIQFRSSSDSEVVLYSLIEWGTTALERFNGMFALGFYDVREKSLLLARDHAGMKPLYYLTKPDGLVFASQYNQILAHPFSRQLEVSQEALGLYLRLAYIPAPFAIFKDSSMVEPGCWILFKENGYAQHGRFFRFPHVQAGLLRGCEAIEAVDAALTKSVKRHLVSDVPVGAFLSGGIDSPLIVAKMHEVCEAPIKAFTIGTGEAATDETRDAMAYAGAFGVEQHIECMDSGKALDFLDDVIAACGEPFGDYSIFPTMMVSRLASQSYRVMLSGDGGDELFWGYPNRFGRLIGQAQCFRYPQWWRRIGRGLHKVFGTGKSRPCPPHPSLGSYHRAMLTHLAESWLKGIFPSLPDWACQYTAFDYECIEPDQAAQFSRLAEFECHLPYVLMKVDRASMFHSLEVRVPFLDKEVIETSARMDWHQCLNVETKVGKVVLRKILSRYTTHQAQGKRGFEVPMDRWLRTSLREVCEDGLIKQKELLGLEVNTRALRKLYDLHFHGQGNYAWGLWPLLSLWLWIENHVRIKR